MLGNWISETTATTGTGTISLGGASAADKLPFSSQVRSGEMVPYFVIDGNNAEEGIGTYTTGSLARTLVLSTKTGSTYADRPTLGISLSGTATVIMAAGKNTFNPAVLTRKNGSGTKYVVDAYLTSSNLSTRSLNANALYLMPFYMTAPVALTGLGCNINTLATTGTVLQLGLYDINPTTNLATLIAQTATINALGVTGYNDALFSSNIYLPAGMYLIGLDSDSNAVVTGQSNFYNSGHPFMPQSYDFNNDGGNSNGGVGSTYTSGTMPASYQLDNNSLMYGNNAWPRLHGVME